PRVTFGALSLWEREPWALPGYSLCRGQRGAAMGEQIERLAQFVAETQWDEIPQVVQRHAKLVLLDTLGVILAGAEQPEVQQLRHRLLATAGTGATVVARGWPLRQHRRG